MPLDGLQVTRLGALLRTISLPLQTILYVPLFRERAASLETMQGLDSEQLYCWVRCTVVIFVASVTRFRITYQIVVIRSLLACL